MKRIYFSVLAALTILAASFLAVRPAQAAIWDLWSDVTCVADLDCTVQTASTAAGNYVAHAIVGKDFEELAEEDVQAMIRGEWNQGLASAIGKVGGLAYNFPPIHFKDYVETELADNLLNNNAQAQVSGASALEPVQEIWSEMRNIAYGLFLIVMMVIGFMIVLQKQISARVVVTFTSALPKVVLGLVLITFSFPLIALIIDVGAVLGTQFVLRVMEGVFGAPGQQLEAAGVASMFSVVPVIVIGLILSGITSLGVTPLVALLFFVGLALAVVVLIALVTLQVIKSYAWILVYTIFAPLLLLFGALPGQEESVSEYFKKILAKTLVFPAILFFLLLGLGFTTKAFVGATATFISGNNILEGALTSGGLLGSVLGLLMFAAAFKAPDMVENALGVGVKKGGKR